MSEIATRGGGEVVQRTAAQELMAQVRGDVFMEQVAMVLPENVPASRFVRAAGTLLLTTPEIAEADPDSVFSALLKAAQDGLLPDGREAAITSFNDSKRGCKVAQYMPMIGGYRKIAAEHGWTIRTNVVYSNDEFSYELGADQKLVHRPAMGNRGERVYAYAIGVHRDGRREIEVFDAAEIAKARESAKTKAVWDKHTDRMWEKTPGKRLFAKLPLDPSDKRVSRLIEDAEVIGPAGAAAMLYGTGGATFQAREITQHSSGEGAESHAAQSPAVGGPDDQAPGEEAPVPRPTDGSQQAGDGMPAAPPLKSQDDAPAPGFQIPDAVIDEAGSKLLKTDKPESGWNDWPISEIAKAKNGPEMLVYCCGPAGDEHLPEDVVAAVRLWVEHRAPELWAQVSG